MSNVYAVLRRRPPDGIRTRSLANGSQCNFHAYNYRWSAVVETRRSAVRCDSRSMFRWNSIANERILQPDRESTREREREREREGEAGWLLFIDGDWFRALLVFEIAIDRRRSKSRAPNAILDRSGRSSVQSSDSDKNTVESAHFNKVEKLNLLLADYSWCFINDASIFSLIIIISYEK